MFPTIYIYIKNYKQALPSVVIIIQFLFNFFLITCHSYLVFLRSHNVPFIIIGNSCI